MLTIKQLSFYALIASGLTFAALGTVVAQAGQKESKM